MKSLIDAVPGCVSLFSMINDIDKKVELIIDYDLITRKSLAFHPLYQGMTVFIKPSVAIDFLKQIDRKPLIFDVPAKEVIIEEQVKVKCLA